MQTVDRRDLLRFFFESGYPDQQSSRSGRTTGSFFQPVLVNADRGGAVAVQINSDSGNARNHCAGRSFAHRGLRRIRHLFDAPKARAGNPEGSCMTLLFAAQSR